MTISFWFYRQLTWGQAAVAFGGFGLVLIGVAGYSTRQLAVELRTWPRVDAVVDSTAVATVAGPKGNVYAARLWLRYTFNGHDYHVAAMTRGEWSEYAFAAADAREVQHAGHIAVVLDPRHPEIADPRLGPPLELFIVPGVFAFLGLVFLAFATAFFLLGRRQGFRHAAQAYSSSPRPVVAILGGMGAIWVIAATVAGVHGPQSGSWRPVMARVDHADVATASVDQLSQPSSPSAAYIGRLYAVRTWLSYTVDGQTYISPVTARLSRNDASATARLAAAITVGSVVKVFVDPGNPYRLVTESGARADAVLIPLGFGVAGLVMLVAAALIHRQMRHRAVQVTVAPAMHARRRRPRTA
jgi:hypothetical protein